MSVHFVCVGSLAQLSSYSELAVVFGTHGIIILMELSSKGIIIRAMMKTSTALTYLCLKLNFQPLPF